MGAKVERILKMLGADPAHGRTPVLLPVEARAKGPRIADWPGKRWADMQREDWVAQIEEHPNCGVLLGEASGGLCTLDFDVDHLVEPFLELNPALRNSLRTRGMKGCQIWLWLRPDSRLQQIGLPSWPQRRYNVNHRTEVFETTAADGKVVKTPVVAVEWRGGGGCQSIIEGIHPQGSPYQTIVALPPLITRFRAINWPKWCCRPWEEAWQAALELEFGPAYTQLGENNYMLTEHYWAGRFRLFHDVLLDPEERTLYAYDLSSGRWAERTREEIRHEVSLDLLHFAREMGLPFFETNGGRSVKQMNAVMSFIEGAITRWRPFDRPPGIVHLGNGMLDLNEPEPQLQPFSPDFMSRNSTPWAYNPGATCPRFTGELLEQGVNAEDIFLLQCCAGSLLLGHNLFQKIIILTGTAGGGKSTLVDILQRMIGLPNVANLRTHLLDERFELEGYIGKTMLSAADVRGDFLQKPSAAMLKSLTGGDMLEAEKKGGKRVHIRGNYCVWITCNTRLTVRMDEDSAAYSRRLVILRYERPKVERPIPHFAELLVAEEASGILNWMIEGARNCLIMKGATGKLFMTPKQVDRVEALLAESESVAHFIGECVEKTDKAEKATVTTDELLHAYREYCADQGWNAVPDSAFLNRCRDAVLRTHRASMSHDIEREFKGVKKAKRGYRHLRLIWEEEP